MKVQKFRIVTALVLACGVIASADILSAADKLRVGGAVYGLKAELANLWAAALKKHPAVKDGTVEGTL
jgi:putative xylitol transport system substrate-binding protein